MLFLITVMFTTEDSHAFSMDILAAMSMEEISILMCMGMSAIDSFSRLVWWCLGTCIPGTECIIMNILVR